MFKQISYVAFVLVLAGIITVAHFSDNSQPIADNAWCDKIYHQNVSCPKFGKVVVPPEVLVEQEANHLAWCDKIYHRNVGCPNRGKVVIPVEVLEQEMVSDKEWCKRVNYRNPSCDQYRMCGDNI